MNLYLNSFSVTLLPVSVSLVFVILLGLVQFTFHCLVISPVSGTSCCLLPSASFWLFVFGHVRAVYKFGKALTKNRFWEKFSSRSRYITLRVSCMCFKAFGFVLFVLFHLILILSVCGSSKSICRWKRAVSGCCSYILSLFSKKKKRLNRIWWLFDFSSI